MKKSVSKRRWLARYRMGKWVPMFAIVQHQLNIDLNAGGYCHNTQRVRLLR